WHLQPMDGQDAAGARPAELRALSPDRRDRLRAPLSRSHGVAGADRGAASHRGRPQPPVLDPAEADARARVSRRARGHAAQRERARGGEEAVTRMLALALTAALLTACGGGAQSSLAPELGRAKPQAVSRMSRGVALAEDDRHGEAVSELEAAVA